MGKYFGTDGIRGKAGTELSTDLAMKTGLALANVLAKDFDRPLVLIGRDERISGSMLECALAAGLMAGGADALPLGVLPTPAVAFITASAAHAAGAVMISASHNPFFDNGIKIFGAQGFKLTDEQENEIERLIDNPPAARTGAGIGRALEPDTKAVDEYCAHIIRNAGGKLDGLRLLIDCANGAASHTAKRIFTDLGAKCEFISSSPDGVNINDNCGSTHMGELVRLVGEGGFDLGVAFDGDADRCLLVDELGGIIDGDRIMGVLARDMRQKGALRGAVVGTIVTNLGLIEYLREMDIEFIAANVGDRYVLEQMRMHGCNLGGEQSGHTVLLDCGTTGDGQMTAARFAAFLAHSGRKASDIAAGIELFPQVTVNVSIPNELKKAVAQGKAATFAAQQCERIFGKAGRVLVRPSGTEPKVRVMVEGRDFALVEKLAHETAEAIKREAGV